MEPEGLLIDGARQAAVVVRELWWRARPPQARRELSLARVTRRLELVAGALYGAMPAIAPSDPPPRPTWLARVFGRAPGHLLLRTAVAATDGAVIWLPRAIEMHDDGAPPGTGLACLTAAADETPGPAPDADGRAIATYRLLMLEQVARASRGTPHAGPRDRLAHDLYALVEASAVDRELARDFRGIAADLRAARARVLSARPALDRLTPLERCVERMIRAVLAADPAIPPDEIPLTATPAASRAWALVTAERLRGIGGSYRGVTIAPLWGRLIAPAASPGDRSPAVAEPPRRAPMRHATLPRRPRLRPAVDGEDDNGPGTWMIRADEPMESVEDPMGLNRPTDQDDDASAADLAESLAELPEVRLVRTPGMPREVLDGNAATVVRVPAPGRDASAGTGIVYPEWDYRLGAYHPRGAVVWSHVATPGSDAWVDGVMARHAALVRRVRRRFDGLRPRRARVDRHDDGPDLDLAAYVAAFADWRAGQPGDDRFYAATRPARRDLALLLLVDISASTDGWVGGGQRIIDVEKESLIVLLEALGALGDRHAALAFSGEGAGRVRVLTVKGFAEPLGVGVRRRVAALEPDGYTRTGAALRHASALLAGEPARRRLLLVLSDGKPNDVDHYAGRYGIRDTAQAVAEARGQGLVPFCLTVDREAPAYMPSLFGPRGWRLLRCQDMLPTALVEIVRRLLVA